MSWIVAGHDASPKINIELENDPFQKGSAFPGGPLSFGNLDAGCLSTGRNWLVVSTPLKNISQNRNLPQIGVKIKNI